MRQPGARKPPPTQDGSPAQPQGSGGFLHSNGIERSANGYVVDGKPLDPNGTYRVAFSDYLLTGQEKNLDFLKTDNPDLTVVKVGKDVRTILADELKRRFTE